MSQIEAWIATHKPQAAAGGLVAVAGIVTLIKRRQAAAAAATGAPTAASVYATTTGTAGTTTTGAPYDSSANDVYNSIQGVLGQLQTTAAQISATAQTQPVPVSPPMQWSVGPNPPFGQIAPTTSPDLTVAGAPATSPVASIPVAPSFNPAIGIAGGYQIAGQTYSELPSLQGLPPGTAEYIVQNGVPVHLSPAQAAALPKGSPIFVQGNDNK